MKSPLWLLPFVVMLAGATGCVSETGIHAAARDGNDAVVSGFISADKGAVNAQNHSGQGPLHLAAAGGHTKTVALLIENGSALNNRDGYGKTPLYYAAESGNGETVELLLLNHANATGEAFNAAIRSESAAAKSILATGNGITPLHRAATENRLEDVKICLAKQWPINAKDYDGVTPLHYAVKNNHAAMVTLLLKNKADVNASDNDGLTPLHYAAIFSDNQMCVLLLAAGAERAICSRTGLTARDMAVNAGRMDNLPALGR